MAEPDTDLVSEEDESDYEYVYETESEGEEEADDENTVIKYEEKSDESSATEKEKAEGEAGKRKFSKEEMESMKPKLPDYITSPEPCAFSDNPCTWIAWMENQVNKERDRRMKMLLDEPEVTEVPDELEDAEVTNEPKVMEVTNEPGDTEVTNKTADTEDTNKTEVTEVTNVPEVEQEIKPLHIHGIQDETDESMDTSEQEFMDSSENPVAVEFIEPTNQGSINDSDNLECIQNDPHSSNTEAVETQHVETDESREEEKKEDDHEDECSEWEYESEQEVNESVSGDNNEVEIDSETQFQVGHKLENGKENEMEIEIETETCDIIVESDLCIQSDIIKVSDSLNDNKLNLPVQYNKQISCPEPGRTKSEPSLVPDDIQRKLDFIRKKKASLGQADGENPTKPSISTNNTASILDEEMQRKLSFIRQKKLEAAQNPENSNNNSDNPVLFRQISNPERKVRPQSIASMANDTNLDDMLSRIKNLREERKQILLDMTAIKNAFGTNTEVQEAHIMDDGICSGNNTPNSELFNSFSNDCETSGKNSPVIHPSLLSRSGRRSIDSGIGSKSLCSVQDGSPTAELETLAVKAAKSSFFGNDGQAARKISKEKVAEDGEMFCFICGDKMGAKLSKGAIMHMGLEDGDPVCPDALYLTDESKEKISQIATTKTFNFEAKYELLGTLDLETWDIDCDIPSGDVMQKVDAFLVDVESQKQRDKERFDAMRNGAIDDIFNEEFAELISNRHSGDTPCVTNCDDDMDIHDSKSDKKDASENKFADDSPPPSFASKMAPPPPPPPPLTASSKHPVKHIPASVFDAIKQGNPHLKHAETIDKSDIPVGQVIHKHLAPIAFTRDIRAMVKDIAKVSINFL